MTRPIKLPEGERLLSWASKADFASRRAEWREGVMGDSSLLHSERVVLWWLAGFFSAEKLHAWPGLARLAEKAQLSERSVGGALAKGARLGWIAKCRGGFADSNNYRLGWASHAVRKPASEMEDGELSVRKQDSDHPGNTLPISSEAGCHLTLQGNPAKGNLGEVPSGGSEGEESGGTVDLLGERKNRQNVEGEPERSSAEKTTEKEIPPPAEIDAVREFREHPQALRIVGRGDAAALDRRVRLLGSRFIGGWMKDFKAGTDPAPHKSAWGIAFSESVTAEDVISAAIRLAETDLSLTEVVEALSDSELEMLAEAIHSGAHPSDPEIADAVELAAHRQGATIATRRA